jgi:hypothetical protein
MTSTIIPKNNYSKNSKSQACVQNKIAGYGFKVKLEMHTFRSFQKLIKKLATSRQNKI